MLIGCVIADARKEQDEYIQDAYKGHDTIEQFEALVYAAVEAFADPSVSEEYSIIEPGEVTLKHYFPHFHAVRVVKISTNRS